jgi:hypothetical protein
VDQGVPTHDDPRHKNKDDTVLRVHDDSVPQGLTDAHKMMTDHDI